MGLPPPPQFALVLIAPEMIVIKPLHCMNEPATCGEGMASGDNSASVQMCPGSRSSLLGQQKEGSQPQAARQAQEAGKEKTIRKNKKGSCW